ncbi:conjugal transfer protein TraF [Chimaeribacter coloradensis]|uniref:Conjugal transfer protein TraF n=1 Tax=Chimaeribacter coloradensis TaxID=2060068 RepID=A0A2N5DUY4_9GAMM|nr:conjugal transfer protein TraF [Chimaeribacter coloradensis]PLR30758.1 conjugal transfer protein TraF [Chimaeribacter coloradensis]
MVSVKKRAGQSGHIRFSSRSISSRHVWVPLFLLSPLSALAAGNYFDARNDAMGGTGVASSVYGSAVLANPALMTKANGNDDVSVIFPAVGVQLTDKDKILNKIDDLSDSVDRYQDNVTSYSALRRAAGDLAGDLRGIQGSQAWGSAGAALAVTLPNDQLPLAFVVKAYGSAHVTADVTQGDIDYLQQIADGVRFPRPGDEDNLTSTAYGLAALVTDYGVAMAHEFRVGGVPVSVGVTPKIQHTTLYNYASSIYDYDKSDITNGEYEKSNTGFNVDAGVTADLSEAWTLGVSAQNLVPRDIDTKEVNGYRDTYQIRPLVTGGAAWHNERVTAAVDVDMTPTKRFKSEEDTQYAGVGAEYRALDWLQLRAGYRADMKSNDTNVFTGGIGLSPYKRVHLDLTGMVGEDNTWGAVAQVGFTF